MERIIIHERQRGRPDLLLFDGFLRRLAIRERRELNTKRHRLGLGHSVDGPLDLLHERLALVRAHHLEQLRLKQVHLALAVLQFPSRTTTTIVAFVQHLLRTIARRGERVDAGCEGVD